MQKNSVNQYNVDSMVNWVKSGAIAVTEIQRPFVWDRTKVCDLMDSLYQGYPVPENVSLLREAFKDVLVNHPFTLDAVVILPDPLHSIWTLPENDVIIQPAGD